jgi:hypothetical protein
LVQETERTWYLKDEPLTDLGNQDRFSHRAYVNLLTEAITELKPPFTLGVFGSWGVGKTSIVNDLRDRLSQSDVNTIAVAIDVWKYQDDSLRRQFLYDLQLQLHDQKALPKGRDYVQEAYEERTEEITGKQRFDLARLRTLAVPLLLSYGAAAALLWLLRGLGVENPIQLLVTAFVAPVTLYLVSEFSRNVTVVPKETITRPVYFSEDQFERKFEELVKDAKCSKLVIIVDNLDRCSHELAVNTLSAIKTFLEPKGDKKCIFVIPCDDAAIKQHVKAAYVVLSNDTQSGVTLDPEQYANEYLRKFFNSAVRIDPFLPEEIEPYIEHLLGQMRFTEDMPGEEVSTLVQMVGFLFRENPRQIKQFLNSLTSKYLLAQQRESGSSPQINPAISDKKLFLAKVAAIEYRFPSLSRKFIDDDNLYPEVASAATTPSRANEIEKLLGEQSADVALLENFLRTTGHLTADNPKAFFHLKQSEQEARVPNYAQFDSALRRGDTDAIREAYEEGQDEDNAARTDVLVRSINDWANKGWIDYALSAIRVAAALRPSLKTGRERLSRRVVRTLATTPGLLGVIQRIRDPKAIFEMIDQALENHRRTVQKSYIDLFITGPGSYMEAKEETDTDFQFQDEVARSFVAHIGSLISGQKCRIRDGTSVWENPRPALLEALTSTDEAKAAFIEPAVLNKVVANISSEEMDSFVKSRTDDHHHHPAMLVLVRCQDMGDQTLANETAEKLAEFLAYAASQNSDPLFWYVIQVGTDLVTLLDQAETEPVDNIIGQIRQKYQSVNPEQKMSLMALLCRFYNRASESERTHVNGLLISDFLWNLSMDQALKVLEWRGESEYSELPWDQIYNRLAKRLVAGPDASQAKEHIIMLSTQLSQRDPRHLIPLLVKLLQLPEVQQTVALVEHAVKYLPQGNRGKSLLNLVLEATLNKSGPHGQPDNHKLLLDFAIKMNDLHTREFKEKLDSHLFNLITGQEPLRQIGIQILEAGVSQGALPEDRYIAILKKLSEWLVQQPTSSPLQTPLLQILGKIVIHKDKVLVTGPHRAGMIKWLAAKQEPSLPATERQNTLNHLVSFGELPREVLYDVIPRLVHQAQNEGNEPTRNIIIDALLNLYQSNKPRDQELWTDLHQFRLNLLNGDDNQKKLGRKLDRDMRKIRQEAGQASEENLEESDRQ